MIKKPNGTDKFPARTCKDLYMSYPELPSGMMQTFDLLINLFLLLFFKGKRLLWDYAFFHCFLSAHVVWLLAIPFIRDFVIPNHIPQVCHSPLFRKYICKSDMISKMIVR